MKRLLTLCIFPVGLILAVCNAGRNEPQTSTEAEGTLPFKPPAKIAKAREDTGGKEAALVVAVKPYTDVLDDMFENDSVLSKAYARFREELPRARQHNQLSRLFDKFVSCPAFWTGKDLAAAHRPVLRQWVQDAKAEKDETTRMLYAQHASRFRVDERRHRHYSIESTQIRPGQELKIHSYHYYYDESELKTQKVEVEIARLTFDKHLKPAGFTLVHTDTARFADDEDTYRRKMKEPGVYRLTLATEVQFVQYYIQVSWLDCVVKADTRNIVVFGSSFRDTLPPPYTVHFIDADGEVYTAATDKQGVCALKHLLADATIATALKVILEKDGQLAFMEGQIPYQQHDTTMEHYIYTDRPVYRPGHRVHFRGMVKLVVDGRWIAPAKVDSVDIKITDPQGSQLWRNMIPVDSWGHFGDSVEIPETNKQGRYTIQFQGVRVKDPDTYTYGSRNYYNYCTFLVDSYKKPEFLITVKPEKERYLADEEAVIKVKGEYYFGGALADVPVTVRWYRQTMGHYFSTWGEERCVFYPSGGREFVRQESLKLSKTGELTLKWKAGAGAGIAYGYVIAEVIATDQSRREVREEGKVHIVKHDAYLAIRPDKYEYEVGEKARIEIVAVDMKGAALAGNVSFRVKKDKGIIEDESLPIPKTGRVHTELKIEEAGTYTLEASAKDRQGKTAFVEYPLRAVKRRAWSWDWERIEITADKKRYAVGDTARLSVKTGADSTRVFCSVEGHRLNAWSVWRLKDHALEYALPITPDLGAIIQFSVVFSGRAQMAYGAHSLTVIDSSLLLRVRLTGTRTLKPGDRFDGTVVVTDRVGKPTKASVSVALVDEAIYDVARFLERAQVYGYDYYSYYRQEGAPEGVLRIIPSWYANRVHTAYNRFDPKFLVALEGVAEAQEGYGAGAPAELKERARDARPAAAPAARTEALASRGMAKDKRASGASDKDEEAAGVPEAGQKPPRERKEFKDLGYWNPSLEIGPDGKGKLSFVMPDDLTKWRLALVGSDGAAHLVEFRDSLVTKQDIMVKLEAPRGFVVDDSAIVATVVHNYSEKQLEAKVTLDMKAGADNVTLCVPPSTTITIPANGATRADWPVRVLRPGAVSFATSVVTSAGSDAETRTYPIRVRGTSKSVSNAGVLGENEPKAAFALPSPQEAAPGSRTLTIEYAPTLAYSMFESLDYLTGYPYGCVEQTMSRFLPNLYVAAVMKRLGLHNDSLLVKIPQYTHKGLERLKQLQHGDGGWGWWEKDEADPRMTALVVHGLGWALGSEIDSKDKAMAQAMLERGVTAVLSQLRSRTNLHEKTMLAHSLVACQRVKDASETVTAAYNQRGKLSSCDLALLLECLTALDRTAEAAKVVEQLETKVTQSGGTAFWGGTDDYDWYRQDEEATARVLRALVNAMPRHPLIPKAVTWLIRSKRDGYWVSTKTTAVVVEAISHYLERTGEFDPDFKATIALNGKAIASLTVTKASLKNWQGRIVLADSLIGANNDLELSMKGAGRLYYAVHLRYATNERPIKARDNGIEVTRRYARLVYAQDQSGDWKVRREEFDGRLAGGDELEVSITIKNDRPYEYMLLEDYFPSGMEVLHKPEEWYLRWRRGWWYGYTHKEARDDRMVFFVSNLYKGEKTFSYLLRAETPGLFTALPARAELMYEPEVSGNSAETSVRIGDAR